MGVSNLKMTNYNSGIITINQNHSCPDHVPACLLSRKAGICLTLINRSEMRDDHGNYAAIYMYANDLTIL
jgi:hypothetical protein